MLKALHAEFQKARRRRDVPVAVGVALVVILWVGATYEIESETDRARGFTMLFYAVPLLNTIVMPLGMAALASRLWDCETKGESCKLLLTLQSRENLFAGKAAMGLLESLLVCLVEAAGVLALAALKQATEPLDAGRFAWLVACTFVINAMLYFFSLWLSMRFRNQTAALAVGFCGALIGLFANFMPVWFSYFVPFGYYVPLCCVRMLYNEATRTSTFTPEPLRWWLLGVGALLAVLAALACRRTIRTKEV